MARKRKGRPINGWIVIDKPRGPTSTQVVGRVKRVFDAAKAGHGGTLDPMASGLLPIAFGEATKTVQWAMDGEKTYRFTVRWGVETDTDDAEGSVTRTVEARPDDAAIEAVLDRFVGEIDQVPPAYSAIKVDGERAYDLAREGRPPELASRPVSIHHLALVDRPDADHAVFEAVSGKGAYMRALARDIAAALGTLGHLEALRRTRVGAFTLDDAVTLEHLDALADEGDAESALLPVETPLDDIPAVALSESQAHQLKRGQAVAFLSRSDRHKLEGLRIDLTAEEPLVLAMHGAVPVALARLEGVEIRPVRVLNLT
ncbi:MAG: tRNA pseudouridine(55) synthase TruB [Azospirillaceae bacterium]